MIMISFHPFFEKGDITSPHFNAEEKNTAKSGVFKSV